MADATNEAPIPLPDDDFRRERKILSPAIFAIPGTERRDRPAEDLIKRETWDHVMHLADDVAIMTSSHQGSVVDEMQQLAGDFLEAVYLEERIGPFMQVPTIFACDELDALIFITLSGYYRQALGCLRNALEVMMHAAAFAVRSDAEGLKRWLDATDEPAFGRSCSTLDKSPFGKSLHSDGYAIFGKSRDDNAWARQLYGKLCGYAHSRAGATNVDFWESNGPIRVPTVVELVRDQTREVVALMYLLLRIAHPPFEVSVSVHELYAMPGEDWKKASDLIAAVGVMDSGSQPRSL